MHGHCPGGTSRTTQIATQESAAAYQLEAQYHLEDPKHWCNVSAWSVGLLSEGDTLLTHRTGIPVQAWWTSPFAHVNFGSGVGPYLAYDGARTENQIGQISPLGLVWLFFAYYSVHIVLICLEK